jgi:TonB family protein
MRFFALPAILLLLVVDSVSSQTITTKPTSSPVVESAPKYRPILLGTGPTALINQIDRAGLVAKGQKNAAIMFFCVVNKTGKMIWSETYRGTPGSKLLEEEVTKRLESAKFVPGIYNSKPVDAVYYGTVVFAVVDGKSRLRIFSNQEAEELKKESDFIGPQPIFGSESKYLGLHYPRGAPVLVDGVVELNVTVDANGILKDLAVKSEEPPFLGFGEAATDDFKGAKFIPAFRNGQPVESKITLPVHYLPKPWNISG